MGSNQAADDGADCAGSRSWRARTALEPTARRARAGAEAPADSGRNIQGQEAGPDAAT